MEEDPIDFLQTQQVACLVIPAQDPLGMPPASLHSPIRTHVPESLLVATQSEF